MIEDPLNKFEITPARIAEVSGITPAMQRDWRHRGIISELGSQQENGRWLYSMKDAFVFWIFSRVSASGFDITPLRTEGLRIAAYVIHKWMMNKGMPGDARRFIRVYKKVTKSPANEYWDSDSFDDLTDRPSKPVCLIIDCHALADEVPVEFDGAFRKRLEMFQREMDEDEREMLAQRGEGNG